MRSKSKFSGYQDDGANYIMSVSDLMSGLLFVFIIILIFFVIRYKSINKSIASRDSIRTEILHTIKEKINVRNLDKNLSIEIDEENGVIHIRDKEDQMFFRSGEAEPEKNGELVIEGLSDILYGIVPCYTANNNNCNLNPPPKKENRKLEAIFIEGHTDIVPVRKNHPRYTNNWDLSTHRAIATYEIMLRKNPALGDVFNENEKHIFSVSGYGETRRISLGDDPKDRQRDRRIDLRFIMIPPKVATDQSDAIKQIKGAVAPR